MRSFFSIRSVYLSSVWFLPLSNPTIADEAHTFFSTPERVNTPDTDENPPAPGNAVAVLKACPPQGITADFLNNLILLILVILSVSYCSFCFAYKEKKWNKNEIRKTEG